MSCYSVQNQQNLNRTDQLNSKQVNYMLNCNAIIAWNKKNLCFHIKQKYELNSGDSF